MNELAKRFVDVDRCRIAVTELVGHEPVQCAAKGMCSMSEIGRR